MNQYFILLIVFVFSVSAKDKVQCGESFLRVVLDDEVAPRYQSAFPDLFPKKFKAKKGKNILKKLTELEKNYF